MTVLPVNSDIIIFQFTVKFPARTLRRSAGNLDRFPSFLEDYDKKDENESRTAMVQWDARDRSGRRTGDFIAAPRPSRRFAGSGDGELTYWSHVFTRSMRMFDALHKGEGS